MPNIAGNGEIWGIWASSLLLKIIDCFQKVDTQIVLLDFRYWQPDLKPENQEAI